MRYIDCAEFIYILNGYNDYIWNFSYYVIEYYRRYKEQIVWQVYMSKLPQCFIQDLPSYLSLIEEKGVTKETPKQSVNKLIERINKYNQGE